MNALKGLYTWTLVTLLILAGCLGTGVINDTEGQSSDDSNSSDNTDDSNSSDNTDDSNSSDSTDNNTWNDNQTNDNDVDNNDNTWDDSDWDEELIMDYQDQFGYFAIGGSVFSPGGDIDQDFIDVAIINTTLFPYANDNDNDTNGGHMVAVTIFELHVDGDKNAAHRMKFTSDCNNGELYFSYIVGGFPAEERFLNMLPGSAFNCTHTISISSNQINDELYWSLVYGVFNGPLH